MYYPAARGPNQSTVSIQSGVKGGLLQITANIIKTDGVRALYKGKRNPSGCAARGLGAIIGNPADLNLVRMQADRTLPPEQRRNYRSIGDAFSRIVREEGVRGLFRGAAPTATRARALNMGMLAANDQAEEMLSSLGAGKQASVL